MGSNLCMPEFFGGDPEVLIMHYVPGDMIRGHRPRQAPARRSSQRAPPTGYSPQPPAGSASAYDCAREPRRLLLFAAHPHRTLASRVQRRCLSKCPLLKRGCAPRLYQSTPRVREPNHSASFIIDRAHSRLPPQACTQALNSPFLQARSK